uniref:Ovule protein n=1 Tax=Haemonchus placei TaxID=6290 RepID=A0A0N4WXD4_HAEPC
LCDDSASLTNINLNCQRFAFSRLLVRYHPYFILQGLYALSEYICRFQLLTVRLEFTICSCHILLYFLHSSFQAADIFFNVGHNLFDLFNDLRS